MKKFENFDGKDDLQLIRERKLGEVEEYATIRAKEFHDLKALMFIYLQQKQRETVSNIQKTVCLIFIQLHKAIY